MAKTPATPTDDGSGYDPSLNIHQRIVKAQALLSVKATGHNQHDTRKAVISIGDVEGAVCDAFAQVGIATNWTYLDPPGFLPDGRSWQCHLRVFVINVDKPEDYLQAEWFDNGANPMAATSFARKGYYKSLLHITEEDDEGQPQGGYQDGGRPQNQQPRGADRGQPARQSVRGNGGQRSPDSGSVNPRQIETIRTLLQAAGRPSSEDDVDLSHLSFKEAGAIISGLQKDTNFDHPVINVVAGAAAFERGDHEASNAAWAAAREDAPDDGGYEEHGFDAALAADDARDDTTANSTPLQASGVKPASANQMATVAKLSRLIGKPEDPSLADMTSAEASQRITELSREYNEMKGGSSTHRRSA